MHGASQRIQGLIDDDINLYGNPLLYPVDLESGTTVDPNDPDVVLEWNVNVQVLPWRGNANFVDPLIVSIETRVDKLGDYHLQSPSPAINWGAADKAGIDAPDHDIDGDFRPQGDPLDWDAGADEIIWP